MTTPARTLFWQLQAKTPAAGQLFPSHAFLHSLERMLNYGSLILLMRHSLTKLRERLKVFFCSSHGFLQMAERLKVEQSGFSKPSGDKPPHLSLSFHPSFLLCVCVCVDPPRLSVTRLNKTACGQHRADELTEAGLGSLYVCVGM